MDVDDVMMAPPGGISSDLFAVLQIIGVNDSGGILTLLCSANSSFPERHSRQSPGSGFQLFHVVFDLYIVGLICLVGFIGKLIPLPTIQIADSVTWLGGTTVGVTAHRQKATGQKATRQKATERNVTERLLSGFFYSYSLALISGRSACQPAQLKVFVCFMRTCSTTICAVTLKE